MFFKIYFAELPQNLKFSVLIFLEIRSSQDMDNCEIIPFAVHYRNNMKIAKGTFLIFSRISKFESCPGFPQQFRVQFEHWGSVQLINRFSNILNVIADDKAYDTDKIASIISDFESDDYVWVVCAVLHCYT